MTAVIWHSLLALCAGIILNAAPCVLPVIPFKVQAVLRDIGHSRARRWGAAAAMWGGSLAFFLILGSATILLGLTWGAMFQSKIFIAVLTLFLLAAGLVTLMGWSVPLPRRLYAIQGKRYVGAALTGVLSAILATPCGGPFLGAVLAYALTQPPLVALMVFLSIGTGLVLPYMVLLTWPWLERRRIKTGPWTVQIKQLLGFVLMGGAIFFAQSLVGPVLGRILWMCLPAALMAWALVSLLNSRGKGRGNTGETAAQWWGQRALPLLVAIACVTTVTARLVAAPAPHLDWQPYSPAAVVMAQRHQQPVMLEFTAEWCLNCKVLEKTTYMDQRVIDAARNAGLVALRVDMTRMEDPQKELMIQYGGRALPYVLIIDRDGKVLRTFTGIFGPETLTEHLEQLVQTQPKESTG